MCRNGTGSCFLLPLWVWVLFPQVLLPLVLFPLVVLTFWLPVICWCSRDPFNGLFEEGLGSGRGREAIDGVSEGFRFK